MPVGYMYILKCRDDTYYTGSTINLGKRFIEHQAGLGANYTAKRLPVSLFYYEEYPRIDLAFNREKQVQNWSRKKKEALVLKEYKKLHQLSICQNHSHYLNKTTHTPCGIATSLEPNCSPSEAKASVQPNCSPSETDPFLESNWSPSRAEGQN